MFNISLNWDGLNLPLFESDEFICEKIENLTWGDSELATSTNPFRAGDIVQNSRPMPRDIVITLKPTSDKGDYTSLLHKLSRMFNKSVRLIWLNRLVKSFTTEYGSTTQLPDITTTCEIDGIVNGLECPRFSDGVRIEINIHCGDPYWKATQRSANLSGAELCLYSDVDPGFTMEINDFALTSTSAVYRLSISYDDSKSSRTLFLKAITAPVNADKLIVTYANNGVTITDDNGVNYANRVRWLFTNNEFPNIPVRPRAAYVGMMKSETGSSNWTTVSGTLKWQPRLL